MDALKRLFGEKGPIKKIGVVGMGYVGIPSAMLFADSKAFDLVLGFQRDSPSSGHKIAMLNHGESPFKGEEPGLEELIRSVVAAGKFRCTSDFSLLQEADAITIAIQTPFLNPDDLEPDLSALSEGLRAVGQNLSPGALVVIESTITPGTTSGMARQLLEK